MRYYNDNYFATTKTSDIESCIAHCTKSLAQSAAEMAQGKVFDSQYAYENSKAYDQQANEKIVLGTKELEKRAANPGSWERKEAARLEYVAKNAGVMDAFRKTYGGLRSA